VENGWTGGAYSIVLVLFGLYSAVLAAIVLVAVIENPALGSAPDWPPKHPLFVIPLWILAFEASLLVVLGTRDRAAAIFLAALWTINDVDAVLVGLLIMHAALPAAPYGSWAARGRIDPGGSWHWPTPKRGAWIAVVLLFGLPLTLFVMGPEPSHHEFIERSVAPHVPFFKLYTLDSVLATLLGLGVAAYALMAHRRVWAWCLLFSVCLAIAAQSGFVSPLLVAFTLFDPRWIAPAGDGEREHVFYDGHCGLCHRSIRFLLAEDRHDSFVFAPLGSETFSKLVPEDSTSNRPDSVVVRTHNGDLLVRSDATVHALKRLGGIWRIFGTAIGIVPRALRDSAYNFIAAIRYRVWGKTPDACPIIPDRLRDRFRD